MWTGAMDRGIDEQLKAAIEGKRLIQVTYHGTARIAEPHDYGVQHGTTKLLVFQLREAEGGVGRGARGWRLLDVSKIERWIALDETFRGSRGQAHRHHLAWDIVYARVG
jgi:hypothetical protein